MKRTAFFAVIASAACVCVADEPPSAAAAPAGSAAAESAAASVPDPDLVVRISSFNAWQDVVGAVCTAVGMPMEGMMIPAAARAQIAQIGSLDDSAPIQAAFWFGSVTPAAGGDEPAVVALPAVFAGFPFAGVAVKLPVGGLTPDSIGLDGTEEKGVSVTCGADSTTVGIDLSKMLADAGVELSRSFPADGLVAAAAGSFAAPAQSPDSFFEAVLSGMSEYAKAAKVSQEQIADAIAREQDNAEAAEFYRKAAAQAQARIDGIDKISVVAKLDESEGIVLVETYSAKPGSKMASAAASAGTLSAEEASSLPASCIYAVSAPAKFDARSGELLRDLAPLAGSLARKFADEAISDAPAAIREKLPAVVPAFLVAAADLAGSATGAGRAFLAADESGRPVFRSSMKVQDAAAARSFVAAVVSAAKTLRRALPGGFEIPEGAVEVSPAEDLDRFVVRSVHSKLVPALGGDGGCDADTLAKAVGLLGEASEAGLVYDPAAGELTASLGTVGSSPVGSLDAAPAFALVDKHCGEGARTVAVAGGSLSEAVRMFARMALAACELDGEDSAAEFRAKIGALLEGVPAGTRIDGAVAVSGDDFVSVCRIPLPEIGFFVSLVRSGSAAADAETDGFDDEDADFDDDADDEEDDADDEDDDGDED
ncbi:MAG: hypothetical protein IJ678_08685 [Kiritimatiellae bacterium]|nr:hypothetical protein [Kiritimatiellia bacterium]